MKNLHKTSHTIINIIKHHIYKNIKQYVMISTIFLIGIIISVILFNNTQTEVKEDISIEINTFINNVKNQYEINYLNLLKSIVGKNVLYTAIIWFMGCTIIGIPIILYLVAYKGFSIGYTIASVVYALGTQKGIVFCILSLLLQNIIIIPSIFALSNSSINLYKVITKDKKRENIKTAILKHTIFSVFIFIILAIASLIETYISNFLLTNYINNI